MTEKLKSCIAIVLAVILAFALAACGNKPAETPWEWAQKLETDDIDYVKFICSSELYEKLAAESGEATEGEQALDFADVSFELDDGETESLCSELNALGETDFSGSDAGKNTAPIYGFVIGMSDGTVYEINRSASELGDFEIQYGETLWVFSSDAIVSFAEALIVDNMELSSGVGSFASSADLVVEEVTGSDLEVIDENSTAGNLG